ncbi:maleylpyruvate isomerase family mycothiol-dependent enzyme [Skermania sp. ID1734]|uniref:maleylpyruvate isomerase family mycothiol-dependent enzyme n=1 Tax=Skermania sp. ID1734 TaxID=2597516 RepID=UPI00118036F1|nr:maleylpyruvate isomerase family mycothiol-dependent enzyme [Skermania sp. ID1734]TSD98100.1 maleylpyruvate isomerase family mycothiol-dependent enzyme [Skermania sp. ID1734]
MAESSVWPIIHAERQALAKDLAGLRDEQWKIPSLCAGWNVQQVLGHMTATAQMTPLRFFTGLAKSGFRFTAMAEKNVAKQTAGSPADTLAAFTRAIDATTAPPGPVDSWLGETIVHSEDIRRPLGIAHDYPPQACARVADFYKRSNLLIGAKNRIAGLALSATDTDWSAGTGPTVSGPILSLVMAMTGRAAALADLTGDGVTILRDRM